jgi:hypothetical protein
MTFPRATNDPIEILDFTSSSNIVSEIAGLGENGYGLSIPSSTTFSTNTKIRAQDWNSLIGTLNAISIHVYNTTTGISTVSNTTTVIATLSNAVNDMAMQLLPDPVRYTCDNSQFFKDPITSETWNTTNGTSTRTLVWDMDADAEITHKVNAAWTSALTARYFFNQGGVFIYKPFYNTSTAATITTGTVDARWVDFIDYVKLQGGYEYTRAQFINPNNSVTKSWTSGTLGISLLVEKNAAKDSILFTVKYKKPLLEIVPSREYWNPLS